ncbi:MAG: glycosyltransferase family A protein [Francisella sp.]
MNSQNKVSILIPVYNRESLIEETVKSAINQTYKNMEIIIVDNKSTDNTWKVLQKLASQDERIKIFQNKTNIGPVRNWKRCVDEASGEYGKILWSDDLMAPDFLEKTVHYLENNDVGFVFTGTEIFVDGKKKSSHYFIGNSGIYKSDKYIEGVLFNGGYPVSPGCALFRMKDLKKNLLVDIPNKVGSDFAMHAIGNDLLIFLLTAYHYNKFAFINEKLSFFRAHGGSITISSDKAELILYYNLAKAFFVERYKDELVKKLNAIILINIVKYFKTAKTFNLNKIENYYLKNKNYYVSLQILIKILIKKIIYRIGMLCSKSFKIVKK